MKSPTTNHQHAARRVAEKAKRDAFNQFYSKLSPDTIAKLKHASLVAANKRLLGTGASADEIVREAEKDFRDRVAAVVKTAKQLDFDPDITASILTRGAAS